MPNDPLAHYGLGLELIHLQQWPDAVAAFSDAIRADANYSAAYYHKARAEIGAGQPDTARGTLEQGMRVARAAGDWHTEEEMKQLLESLS
jgi:tetratricopeptide (TPR) repeat protein